MSKFIQIDSSALDFLPKISPLGFTVYSFLKEYMNQDTKECFPSMDTLSIRIGCNKKSVTRVVKLLEHHGMIKVARQRRKANVYSLTHPSSWVKNPREYVKEKEGWELPLPDSYYEGCIREKVEISPYPEYTSLVHCNFETGELTEVGREYVN
jgi:hypothetical protein